MLPKCNFQNHKGHFEFKNSLSPAINSFPSTLLHCQCQHLEKEAFKYRLFNLELPYCCSFNLKACQAEDFVTEAAAFVRIEVAFMRFKFASLDYLMTCLDFEGPDQNEPDSLN